MPVRPERQGLSLEMRLARTGRWELDGFEAANRFPEPLRRAIPENPEDLEGLLGGLLVAVIRFGALVSLAAHFSTEGTRDADVARDLRLLETSWSDGRWLDVWRSAVQAPGPLEGKAWPRAFAIVEEESTVSIVDGTSGLRTDRLGLISAWISLRNRLLGHSTLDRAEAAAASREVRRLVSAILAGLVPAFSAAVDLEARPKGREAHLDIGPGGRLRLSPFVVPGEGAGEMLLLDAWRPGEARYLGGGRTVLRPDLAPEVEAAFARRPAALTRRAADALALVSELARRARAGEAATAGPDDDTCELRLDAALAASPCPVVVTSCDRERLAGTMGALARHHAREGHGPIHVRGADVAARGVTAEGFESFLSEALSGHSPGEVLEGLRELASSSRKARLLLVVDDSRGSGEDVPRAADVVAALSSLWARHAASDSLRIVAGLGDGTDEGLRRMIALGACAHVDLDRSEVLPVREESWKTRILDRIGAALFGPRR